MQVLIEDLTSSGEGVGTIDGKKVFVDGALPKELVQIEIHEEKKRYSKANLLKIINPSPDRVEPICPLFGECGGCQIMHLSYEEQLVWKQKRIKNTLERLGGIKFDVSPCVPSPDQLGYRNKVHLHSGGFHKRHSHEIVPVDRCYIHNEIGEKSLPLVKNANEAIIKTSLASGEVLHVIDGKPDREYIIETLDDLSFKIRPFDFFQVNPKQATRLYQKAIEYGQIDHSMSVLDAYCGVGCLSLFAARHAKEVLGIEAVKSSVEGARENAKLNGIENVSFECGRVEKKLSQIESFDLIFLNPPRGGVDEAVLKKILEHPPKRLIYISCDPATLSRDLKTLQGRFRVEEVFPFDMFPQTVHVETLAILHQFRGNSS